jgi:hypothetical protein
MKQYFLVFLCFSLLLGGCSSTRPLKPGQSSSQIGNDKYSLNQSENPAASSSQDVKYDVEKAMIIPKDSVVTSTDISEGKTNILTVTLSKDSELKVKENKNVNTVVGAAQKDTAREIGAKLKSLSILIYVGIVMVLFGGASLFWPPLKLIIGSNTTSLACIAIGVGFIMLPSLVVGSETLILCIGAGAIGLYFFAHRYGGASREIKVLREFVDKNKDNLDDNTGQTKTEFFKKSK